MTTASVTEREIEEMLAAISTKVDGGDRRLFNSNGDRLPFMADTLTKVLTLALSAIRTPAGEVVGPDANWLSRFSVASINHAALDSAVGVLRIGLAGGRSYQQALWSALVDYVERVPRASPAPVNVEVTDEMVGRAWQAFDAKGGYSKPEKFRAALTAALSHGEPK